MFARRSFAVTLAAAVAGFALWSAAPAPNPAGAQEEKAAPPTVAAEAFLATLDAAETELVLLDPASPSRLDWHFIPKQFRKGLALNAMSEPQRRAARGLLASLLSAVGYERAENVMELEAVLAELEGDAVKRDPLKYSFTLFGRPGGGGADGGGRWAASVEGHHLSLNFLMDGNEVAASTPLFFGANPATVPGLPNGPIAGVEEGTRVLAGAEDAAFAVLNGLTPAQLKEAHIDPNPPREIRGAGVGRWTPPPIGEADGVRGVKLTPPQRDLLETLVGWHLAALPDAERAEQTAAMTEAGGIRALRFAWLGALEPGVGHGYRVRGPSLLIEYVNTQPDSLGNPANHAHAVLRDPEGDFGLELRAETP